jgi:pantetheine-phosphate adenylyltransferase
MKKCVFAGTFDPPTLGHQETIEQCLALFDRVVVAVMVNPNKKPHFSSRERREMLRLTLKDNPRVKIVEWKGTVAELLQKENTKIYVRGIRNATDLDYENADLYASHKLDKELLAVYLPCRQELLHVSSSMVRNSLHFNTPIDEYVSKEVKEYIENLK